LWVAVVCLVVGEAFIFLRWRPVTDYYFILVWGGYILLVDYLVFRRSGRSLLRDAPLTFLAMFPASAVFWWLFEGYNQFVQNWTYLGGQEYQGLKYVLVASLFFSTVVPAVWETAELLLTWGMARRSAVRWDSGLWAWLPVIGVVLAVLPLVWPRWAFPLVWVGLFVVLDPLNARAGRPSILAMLLRGQWRVPLAFYAAATITGFFWEFWNYWAWPKWIYTLPPLVEWFPKVFEMPLPGYFGYGPFAWELFAMWHFVARGWAAARWTADRPPPTAADGGVRDGGAAGRTREVAGG
jgi:hypothetical protein